MQGDANSCFSDVSSSHSCVGKFPITARWSCRATGPVSSGPLSSNLKRWTCTVRTQQKAIFKDKAVRPQDAIKNTVNKKVAQPEELRDTEIIENNSWKSTFATKVQQPARLKQQVTEQHSGNYSWIRGLETLIPASTPQWITRNIDSILTFLGIKSEPGTPPGKAEPHEIFTDQV